MSGQFSSLELAKMAAVVLATKDIKDDRDVLIHRRLIEQANLLLNKFDVDFMGYLPSSTITTISRLVNPLPNVFTG